MSSQLRFIYASSHHVWFWVPKSCVSLAFLLCPFLVSFTIQQIKSICNPVPVDHMSVEHILLSKHPIERLQHIPALAYSTRLYSVEQRPDGCDATQQNKIYLGLAV